MKRALAALALLAVALQAQAAPGWSALWHNADQRGQALLQQGKAAAAAQEFHDPRRKSYAEFRAGNYPAAARELAGLDDSEAQYNRGNALAYAGDLKGALDAYDAALKRDPGNRDARHNRDVVAKALKQQQQTQPQQQQHKQGGNKDSQQGSGNDKQQGKQDKSGEDKQQGGQNGQDRHDQSSGSDAAKPGQGGKPQNPADSSRSEDDARRQGKDNANPQGNGQSGQQQAQARPQDKLDDAAQARRDAAGALGQDKRDQAGEANDAGSKPAAATPAPPTEKQISQDQWLRSIPDDPAGLLRRKFLIEHMMRQQRAQP